MVQKKKHDALISTISHRRRLHEERLTHLGAPNLSPPIMNDGVAGQVFTPEAFAALMRMPHAAGETEHLCGMCPDLN